MAAKKSIAFLIICLSSLFALSAFAQANKTVPLNTTKEITPWETGYSVTVTLTNDSAKKVLSWQGSFLLPEKQKISGDFWGASVKKDSTVNGVTNYTVTNNHSYAGEGEIAPGDSVKFGGQITKNKDAEPGISNLTFQGTPPQPPIPGKGFLKQTFAPYVDVMLYPEFPLKKSYKQTGQKYYTLAFITASQSGQLQPAWGGITPTNDYYYVDQINYIREQGGDVILSFGGANGTPLAAAIHDVDDLVKAYKSVISEYQPTWIDFDVEGLWVHDHASIDRRNAALKIIQAEYPNIKIAYVLPILPTGLTEDGRYVLQSAQDHGVKLDIVNAMAMDFGSEVAPPTKPMQDYIVESAENLHKQLKSLYPEKTDAELWSMVGITPMIGQNDAIDEVVWQSDAQAVEKFAADHKIGFLSMWSSTRDNGAKRDENASPSHSGIKQKDFEFTNTFKAFTSKKEHS